VIDKVFNYTVPQEEEEEEEALISNKLKYI
jgi:hypothetical protein